MEETCEDCRSAATNEAHYTNASRTSQENLHYEIQNHNAKYSQFHRPGAFSLLKSINWIARAGPATRRI
ncbi:hypothetical protein DIE06_17855 [Burkholderia sp. Bp8998]|nr:hypothetical protein DIE06_17855 [Burkholderia sp. Bp8998]